MDLPDIDFDSLFTSAADELDSLGPYTSSEEGSDGLFSDNETDFFDWDDEMVALLQPGEVEELIVDEIIDSCSESSEKNIQGDNGIVVDRKKHELTNDDEASLTAAPTKKLKQNPRGRPKGKPKVADFPKDLAEAFNSGSVDEIVDVVSVYVVPDCVFRAFHLDREYVGRRYIVELMKFLLRKSSDIVEVVKKVRIEPRSSMRYTVYNSWTSLPFSSKCPFEDDEPKDKSLLNRMDLSTLTTEQIKELADREKKFMEARERVQIVGRGEISLRLNRHNQITQFTILSFRILSFDSIPDELKQRTPATA